MKFIYIINKMRVICFLLKIKIVGDKIVFDIFKYYDDFLKMLCVFVFLNIIKLMSYDFFMEDYVLVIEVSIFLVVCIVIIN